MMEYTKPEEIEKRSFEMIRSELPHPLDPAVEPIILRVIHTTADFDYADNLVFSDNVVTFAKDILKSGAQIVTDTNMAKAGINDNAAKKLGCSVHCFINTPEVIKTAQENGLTRARAAVDHASKTLSDPVIFVAGNAPTALIRLHELIRSNVFIPAMIIGVPVGFVNVVESKELILGLQIPHIVAIGRKGGSNVAAAICNALLYEITKY